MEGQMKEFLREIILQAGRITLEFRRNIGKLAIDRKALKDFVSEADRAVENFLIEQIRRQYPDHGIFGEETGTREGGEYRWIIDPIDGTTSFIHGQPFYCISIALQHNGQTILAAVNAPVLGELFEAGLGGRLSIATRSLYRNNPVLKIRCWPPHLRVFETTCRTITFPTFCGFCRRSATSASPVRPRWICATSLAAGSRDSGN